MEDGPDDVASSAHRSPPPPLNNGDVMANFPNEPPPASPIKVNGDATPKRTDDRDSSDCDNLVIDESVKPTRRKRPKKTTAKKDSVEGGGEFKHTNPYFSESIFELSNFYNNKPQEKCNNSATAPKRPATKGNGKRFRGKNGKPKLRDYAQYLGLQPSVQFRCRKCGSTGFQSLQAWNEHFSECTSVAPAQPPPSAHDNATKLSVKRKVFLCSACGTYYENWNLFLHMREVHRRFICLYCLGMFPHAEKLSAHLVSKHGCSPAHFDSIDDFLDAYRHPCFLMCCACQAVFSERENFFDHRCVDGDVLADVKPEIETAPVDGEVECAKIKDASEKTDEERLSPSNRADDEVGEECRADERDSECNSEINMIENENDGDAVEDGASAAAAVNEDEQGGDDVQMDDANSDEKEEECGRMNSSDTREDEVEDDGDENKLTDAENNDENEYAADDECGAEEIRKVPKVTLKLPKLSSYEPAEDEEEEYQSEDSDKLTMEIEKESDTDVDGRGPEETSCKQEPEDEEEEEEEEVKKEGTLPTAGSDIAIIELELEQPLDKFDIKLLLQKCLRSTIATCLYCNHARKISVNGKQLGLHAIAEHRYSAIVKSITAEELIPESFNARIKECLPELENVYFNLESTSSEGGITFSHIFECFQCRYSTTVHKELYLHNRKLHAKAILLCIMCKTSFYSYCELICHLCPGIYALENDVQFRCCLCVGDDLPSAFRLMVHLRKKHHVCDVCLEMCHDQSRLSNHVWKHKLHHLCYRCGIAYRNKPDITKHLYWKHGTESVLCKRCLQKKWPHVYHFCIPPNSFPCEECGLTFTRSVYLTVHKRLHSEVYPHACSEEGCAEKFVSRKLLLKHDFKHRQPVEEPKKEEEDVKPVVEDVCESADKTEEVDVEIKPEVTEEIEEKVTEKPKPKVDVYDLPELNLSESDSSDSDDEDHKKSQPPPKKEPEDEDSGSILEPQETDVVHRTDVDEKPEPDEKPVPVLEHVWDNFNDYQAKIAKLDILTDVGKEEPCEDDDDEEPKILTDVPEPVTLEDALLDHDYCAPTADTLKEEEDGLAGERELGPDHDYCTDKKEVKPVVAAESAVGKKETAKRRGSSDSSSNSDSSSCTCGSNCSCSSSSSNSSSSSSDSSESDSSSEEGRRRQQVRRERRRQKKLKKESENAPVDVEAVPPDANAQPPMPAETLIQESDLETTESDTDEDFYDKQPQKLASKLLAEKREKLLQMAGIGPYINGSMIDSRPSTPNLSDVVKPKKKSKSKKKKKRKSSKHDAEQRHVVERHYSPQIVDAVKSSPLPIYNANINSNPVNLSMTNSMVSSDNDTNTRASKRRRVPNKFYGYSSDEDGEKMSSVPSALKMRKVEVTPKSPMIVPPLMIKTAPPAQTVEPISIRMTARAGEMRVQPLRLPFQKRTAPKVKPLKPSLPVPTSQDQESGSDSNTSSSEDESVPKPKEQPALYCYCRCPYDEVSEMIGCDSDDCAIEWFHFECVGIMVPPKGQWYCPDCRKKKQQRRDMLQHAQQMSSS